MMMMMKTITGGDSKGMLGEFEYLHIFQRGLGHRIDWLNPPPAGTRMVNHGEPVTVDEIGMAGMLAVTRKSDGVQSLVFPWDLKLPERCAHTVDMFESTK